MIVNEPLEVSARLEIADPDGVEALRRALRDARAYVNSFARFNEDKRAQGVLVDIDSALSWVDSETVTGLRNRIVEQGDVIIGLQGQIARIEGQHLAYAEIAQKRISALEDALRSARVTLDELGCDEAVCNINAALACDGDAEGCEVGRKSFADMVDKALTAECGRIASEIEAAAMESPPNGARVGMVIAARIVRRGRRLTFAEQMENLSNALRESDAEKAG